MIYKSSSSAAGRRTDTITMMKRIAVVAAVVLLLSMAMAGIVGADNPVVEPEESTIEEEVEIEAEEDILPPVLLGASPSNSFPEEKTYSSDVFLSDGSYVLSHNITLTEGARIVINGNVTLNLNGYVISRDTNESTRNKIIFVNSGKTLTLQDTGDHASTVHYFINSTSETTTGLWEWGGQNDNGSEKLTSGDHEVTGGVITGGYKDYGGGIQVNGQLTVCGGNIVGNSALSGGGVLVVNNGELIMEGGSIAGNYCSSCGGGVFIDNGGDFDMSGGSIMQNKAGSGGGVYVNSYQGISGIFTLTGGTIENNSCTANGGGVYHKGTFTVGGNAVITGNKVSDVTNNAYLEYGSKITLATGQESPTPIPVLTSGASIGVSTGSQQSVVPVTSNYPETASETKWESYFTSDKPDYKVCVNDMKVVLSTSQFYTVVYFGNGADGGAAPVDQTKYNSGSTVTVLGNTGNLVKTGCTFAGWNTKSDGTGTTYTEGKTFSITANTTLYAQWSALYEFSIPDSITVPEQLNGYNTGVVTLSSAAQLDGYNLNLRLSTNADSTGEYDNKTLDLFHLTKTGSLTELAKYSMTIYQHNSDNRVKDVTGRSTTVTDNKSMTADNSIVAQLNLGDSGSKSVTYDLRYIARSVPTESGTYSGTLTFEVSQEKITS